MREALIDGHSALPTRPTPLHELSLMRLEDLFATTGSLDTASPVQIIEDADGSLLVQDGNHRLTATIEHGCQVVADIFSGSDLIPDKKRGLVRADTLLPELRRFRKDAIARGFVTFSNLHHQAYHLGYLQA